MGVIVVRGGGDYLEHYYYDFASGRLLHVRYRVQTASVGTQVTELSWVGQQ